MNRYSQRMIVTCLCLLSIVTAGAADFTYVEIASRYKAEQLSVAEVQQAKMQGECLVGLKQLNFRSSEEFDPVAEWTNYRSLSLLEQFPPCTLLVMMEVARKELLGIMGEEE
jgi:hypothetical protein